MKFGDITKRMNGKQQIEDAKTNEELDRLCTSDTALLTDDQLDSVAGGVAGVAGKTTKVTKKVIK